MQAMTYSKFKKNPKQAMDKALDSYDSLIITRKEGNMVLMSLNEYNALQETLHVMSSPKNYERILTSIHKLNADKGRTFNRHPRESGDPSF